MWLGNDDNLYLIGSLHSVKRSKYILNGFLVMNIPYLGENDSYSVINFNHSISHSKVFNEIEENEQYLELSFQIKIKDREVIVGHPMKVLNFKKGNNISYLIKMALKKYTEWEIAGEQVPQSG